MRATEHAKLRAKQRRISAASIADALTNPLRVVRDGTVEQRRGRTCMVVIDTSTDTIVTVAN